MPTKFSEDVILNSPLLRHASAMTPLVLIWTEERFLACHSPTASIAAWSNRSRRQSEIRQLLLRTLDHLVGTDRSVAESILKDTEAVRDGV